MKYLRFNFNTIKNRDSVVVLCAGPSLIKYKSDIRQYIKKENSIVLSANYNYNHSIGIKSDYTYITDQLKLFENLHLLNSHLIVPSKMKTDSLFTSRVHRVLKYYDDDDSVYIERKKPKFINVYKVGDKRQLSVYKQKKIVKMDLSGEFPYKRLGSAGQSCVLLSLVFKPKKILIVGLDGNVSGDISKKKMFDGRVVNYASEEKHATVIDYLKNILFPSVLNYNVQIETFSGVEFYGLDKKKLGITVIRDNL